MNRPSLVALAFLVLAAACDKTDAAPEKTDQAPAKAAQETKTTPEKANPEAKAAPPEPESYGKEFCATIIPCFEKLEFSGNFSAEVSVDIRPDGGVEAVSYAGDAPKPVQTCVVEAIKAIQLSDYNGKPGRTRCSQSGQLSSGARMVMADMSYEIRDADAPADTPAADAPAQKADEKADPKDDSKTPE